LTEEAVVKKQKGTKKRRKKEKKEEKLNRGVPLKGKKGIKRHSLGLPREYWKGRNKEGRGGEAMRKQIKEREERAGWERALR